ncbi:GFA family protein [Pyxidicoccus xibeiensis]|uniref:GFA family protein n=1 Tax=Pyxidicoccus xibeiensis TaxID=2906759 RepID=UPI0020A80995|nr:GFA family protein [Pyxidicoccus xibeiensis]MCP3138645.1 GFA family protein [Pyxidicoccus xibeiensis]
MTPETETNWQQLPNPAHVKKYVGGCHCGAVRFEADLDLTVPVNRCNCTICLKAGGSTINVKPHAFRLVAGADSLGRYGVDASPNHRAFCKRCGIMCFGEGDVAELGGEFRTVHVNCLEDVDLSGLNFQYWDGRHDNWMAGPRSKPWPNVP